MKQVKRYIWPFGPQRIVLRSFTAAIGKTAVLLPASFVAATGMGMIALGIIFFMQGQHELKANTLGLFSALYNLSYVTGCFLLRPLSRRMLPRFSLILASSLMGILALSMLFLKSVPVIFIIYSLYGFATSLFWPPLMGWLSAGIEGSVLNKTIARWNFSWSLGTIISPFITGVLAERDIHYPLYLGICLLFIVCTMIGVASYSLRRIRIDTHRELKPTKETLKNQDQSTYLRFPGWAGLLSAYILLGVMSNIFPIYAREGLLLPESRIGIVLLMRALFAALGFTLAGKTEFWHFKGRFILGNQVLLALLLLLLIPLQRFYAYLFVMPLLGLLSAFIYSNAMFHGVSGSIERGKRMSIQESLLTVGIVLGSLIGGQVYHRFSMNAVFVVCLMLIGLAFIFQLLLVAKNTRKRNQGPSSP